MGRKSKTAFDEDPDVDRRGFFGALLRELARPIAEFQAGLRSSAPETATSLLRPPGALPEPIFLDRCEQTGECVRACPANAIFFDPETGYPAIDPVHQPCVVCSDLACMSACPTGALQPRPATELGMGLARVNAARCVRSDGVECRLCVQSCPLHELGVPVLEITLEGRVVVDESACVGCGVCVRACPTEPKAIQILPTRILPTAEKGS